MTEIEEVKAQLEVLQSKLSLLEKLEKIKSPVEKAYKDWWGEYPETGNWTSDDDTRWLGFAVGYNFAQRDYKVREFQETAQERGERVHKEMEETIKIHDGYEVVEYQPTPQTPEQVVDGLKEAFREAVKQGVVSSSTKPQTLYDLIAQWYLNSVTDNIDLDVPTCINDLVNQIEVWLPKEQFANSQNAYVECAVEGYNDCLNKIKGKLR